MAVPSGPAVARYRRIIARHRLAASAALVGTWDRLESYDEPDRYAAEVAPLLAGAKTATVATATAFYALVLDTRAPAVKASAVSSSPALRDPFVATWHALAMGRAFDEAIAVGRSTADATGSTFVQSTARRTGDAFADATGRTGRWARIPSATACAWCQEIAGDHYLTAESADFGHERCGCVVAPA